MNAGTATRFLSIALLVVLAGGCASSASRNPNSPVSEGTVGHVDPGTGALGSDGPTLTTATLTGQPLAQPAVMAPATELPPVVVLGTPPTHPPSIAEIKAMAKEGVSDDAILRQIDATHAVYYLDADTTLRLQYAGVSEKVITRLINSSTNTVFSQAPPAPESEAAVAAPGPDFIWIPGEWVWRADRWAWIGGGWVLPPDAHSMWIVPHWEHRADGWHRVPGYWR